MRSVCSPNLFRFFYSTFRQSNSKKPPKVLTKTEIKAIQLKKECEQRAKIDPEYAIHFHRMEKINREAQRDWDSLSPEEKEKCSAGRVDSEKLKKAWEEYSASRKYYSAY